MYTYVDIHIAYPISHSPQITSMTLLMNISFLLGFGFASCLLVESASVQSNGFQTAFMSKSSKFICMLLHSRFIL